MSDLSSSLPPPLAKPDVTYGTVEAASTPQAARSPDGDIKRLSDQALASLTLTLEIGIDERLNETRTSLRRWLREAVHHLAQEILVVDPATVRRRRVAQTLKLRGERMAELLLILVDQPDVYHGHGDLAGNIDLHEDVAINVKNIIRVSIFHLRTQLKRQGVEYVIRNQNRGGYMMTSIDARRIKMLWGEYEDAAGVEADPPPLR